MLALTSGIVCVMASAFAADVAPPIRALDHDLISIARQVTSRAPAAGSEFQALPYAQASANAIRDSRPLLVVCKTSSCEPCRRLVEDAIPEAARSGALMGIEVSVVDVERQAIAWRIVPAEYLDGGAFRVPTIVYYRFINGAWRRKVHIGGMGSHELTEWLHD